MQKLSSTATKISDRSSDEKAANNYRGSGNVPAVRKRKSHEDMPDVRSFQSRANISDSVVERLGDDELETQGLQASVDFAEEFDIPPIDVRPCIALAYYQGVSFNRHDWAFKIAYELYMVQTPQSIIRKALQNYNARLGRYIKASKLDAITRDATSGKYDKPYRCEKLQDRCIGQVCPWSGRRTGATQKLPLRDFASTPWLSVLKSGTLHVWLGLNRMRLMRGYPAGCKLIFNFDQLSELISLSKRTYRDHLESLERHGLITDLQIGSGWGTGKRMSGTTLTFVHPIPDPFNLSPYVRRTRTKGQGIKGGDDDKSNRGIE